jgi:Zn-finger nucleic acid-binding protein
MLNSSSLNSVYIIILILIIVGIAVKRSFWRYSLRRPSTEFADSAGSDSDSEIISFYSAGHTLANAGQGELNSMRYTIYESIPIAPTEDSVASGLSAMLSRNPGAHDDRPLAYVNSLATVFALDLPFNTQTHLLGLSTEHGIDRLQFENFMKANGLVKVVLEGDFRDYFDIYAAPGQDVAVRTVLNPETMDFVVDYCRTHFWEINASTLYIVASESDKGADDIVGKSQQFVQQVKPALLPGDPGAAPVHHETPYGEYDGPALLCPICQKTMTQTDNWQACPDGHGVLLNGRDLIRLHQHNLTIPSDAAKAQQHGSLSCPNCHSQMESVNYEETGVTIESCPTCPFRWLDADAMIKLASSQAPVATNSDSY